MQIKYKIVEAYPDDHQIIVRYYTDLCPESAMASQVDADGNIIRCRTDTAITLPIPAPSGVDLDVLIQRRAPRHFFELKEAVANPNIDTSLSGVLPLVGVERAATLAPVETNAALSQVGVVVRVS